MTYKKVQGKEMKFKGLLVLVLALVLGGCAPKEAVKEVSNEEKYKSILDAYKVALEEEWDNSKLFDNNLNYMVDHFEDRMNHIGYYFIDLDGDGSDELLIGGLGYDEVNNIVLDIYTYVNDEVVLLAQGGERSAYYIIDDNDVLNSGASSAYESTWSFKKLKDGKLEEYKRVDFVGSSETESTWTLIEGSQEKELSEEEALNMIFGINDHALEFNFTPFANYAK